MNALLHEPETWEWQRLLSSLSSHIQLVVKFWQMYFVKPLHFSGPFAPAVAQPLSPVWHSQLKPASEGLSFLQSDSPLVWSSCHHQKCNFGKLLLCLKSFIDLLIPSGCESFPKIHDLFYLGPPVIFWFLELIIPFQVFVFISAIPPFFPLTP